MTGVLIELGVPKEQLIPRGLGFEELACQNRKVMIVDVNGQDAELINKGE